MAEPTAAHARDLGDYVSLAHRRWAWIAGSIVAGLVVALAYVSVAEETYMSTAKVLVEETGADSSAFGDRTNDDINLDTEAQLVQSAPVSSRAAEMLGTGLSPVTLANRVSVTVPPNTTVMNISFTASTAKEAQQGAAMFAKAYLEHRQETAQGKIDKQVDRLSNQIEETQEEVQDLSVTIARLTGPQEIADRAFTMARRSTLSQQLASLNGELAPLVGNEVTGGEVILEAQLPDGPVDPNPWLILPAGLMAGLVVGLGLAVWRERIDKRIHSGAEVARLFGMPPLATLTASGAARHVRVDHDVQVLYHSLRANAPESGEVLLLVGPDAPDTAENLAYSLGLVAARTGSAAAFFTRPRSAVVRRRHANGETSDRLELPDYEELGVVVDGAFRSSALREELRVFSSDHDFVILGLPNDDPRVDLPILGRHVDVAVLVVRLGVTRRDTVTEVLSDLTKSGVPRVFAVTVDLGRRHLSRKAVWSGDVFGNRFRTTGSRSLPVTGLKPVESADLGGDRVTEETVTEAEATDGAADGTNGTGNGTGNGIGQPSKALERLGTEESENGHGGSAKEQQDRRDGKPSAVAGPPR